MTQDFLSLQVADRRGVFVSPYLKEIVDGVSLSTSSVPLVSMRKFTLSPRHSGYLYGNKRLWRSKTHEAKCLCFINEPAGVMKDHYATNFAHATCGVYSFKVGETPDLQYLDAPVTAFVKNYGLIIEFERGYRSEICVLDRLYVNYEQYLKDCKKIWNGGVLPLAILKAKIAKRYPKVALIVE